MNTLTGLSSYFCIEGAINQFGVFKLTGYILAQLQAFA